MITAKNLVEEKYASVQMDDSVSKVSSELKRKNSSEALVFDGEKFKGMVSFRELFKNHDELDKVKVGKLIKIPPMVESSAKLYDVAKLMLSSNFRLLPVFEKGNLIGVISATDLVPVILSVQDLSSKKANEVMSKNTLTITESESMDKTIALMKSKRIKKLPVINNREMVVGMVTWENILQDYLVPFRHSARSSMMSQKVDEQSTVSSVIDNKIQTVTKDDSLSTIIQKWPSSPNPVVAVLENQKISGIITTRDLLKLFIDSQPVSKNIHFVDLPESVDGVDLAELNSLVNHAYDKMEKMLGDDAHLTIHFKSKHVLGLKHHYDIHARARMDNKTVFFKAQGWSLVKVTHDALKGLEKVVLKNVKGRKR